VFVHDSVYDAFVSQLVERVAVTSRVTARSRPRSRSCAWGRDELLEQIEDGVASGCELLIGGGTAEHDKGFCLEPAVVAVMPDSISFGHQPRAPFGGVKASGFGKEHGIEALDSYVELKSVVVGGLS
jgi:acyl-CoA reductase-like NAD-dependent aldehyde dehydrogenase